VPWFAIGGIDAGTLSAVRQAGAERVVVVRAIRDATDPEGAAHDLRRALEESPVGAAR
jgi:thiamine-phosphate pyrophosphorylase